MSVGAIAEIQMGGSPTRARTWDLRINSPTVSSESISNQALATHAKFQEQHYTASNECHEGKKSYEMATLLVATSIFADALLWALNGSSRR